MYYQTIQKKINVCSNDNECEQQPNINLKEQVDFNELEDITN